ncbi:aminotransferase class I/II-fold pyridoxal phosphate-dependent enzyme [Clostridium sp. 001]|uniref:aminotransferase class I/II-fold pyridoxal phosphate-dependent enzyme n=1 Tax=Clostridium sp. 001 TaxID=1970093 RepID=UPI001C2BA709|nr:aminotransferase class V-fold PLP-dependent enzyme [Clostridium sp. 001]QXE19386.1 decarboxylase [Clostridium sp. 001]
MSELPLLEGVLKYIKENNISFCMPGHKNGRGFYNTSIGREFISNILKFDITEVDGVDNLHNQKSIILDASKRLSKLYGSKKSYFLVNGSTSGNMIMLFSNFNEGDKVLVERNCHSSILNGIIMRKLIPIYLENIISEKINAPICINLEHFLQVLKRNKDIKGIVVTYPNYYGICSNLKFIIKEAKKLNIKVLVDCAHGAHFGINKNLPESAVKLGADMVVTSSHKTLPSLTQTAYLHVNNEKCINKVDFYYNAFLSTSPSYIALCSMDYARFYLEKYGSSDYEKLIEVAEYYRNKINSIRGLQVIGRKDIIQFNSKERKAAPSVADIDLTRYTINLESGYSGNLLLNYLRKLNMQCEMSDNSNLVLIFSPFNEKEEFERLYTVLKNCNLEEIKCKKTNRVEYGIPQSRMLPFQVIDVEKEMVDLNNSCGRISGASVIPYPPGVPVLSMGELIDKNVIQVIKYYIKNSMDLIGVKDNKIKVVK